MLDSTSETSLVATPTSSAMLSDLLSAAEGASSKIESLSTRVLPPLAFCFATLLADDITF